MSGEIRIQIEDDDTTPSNAQAEESIEDIRRRGEESAAEVARLRHEAARYRAETARNRVSTALTRAGMEAQEAATEYRGALEAGDIDLQAGAQSRMAEVEARRARLQEHAELLERSQRVQLADPVEAACAGKTATTANWLRSHPEHVRDPRKLAKLQSAHFDAEAEGLVPDTSEYFSHIERTIGLSDGLARGSGDRAAARPAMKVNRNDPSTHVQHGGAEVYLTKGERERATDGTIVWNHGSRRGQPIGIQEFARRKSTMHAEGRYSVLSDLEK
jgi:hypothetical protein